jgi:hypothetical protein
MEAVTEPSGHAEHSVAPEMLLNEPATHAAHVSWADEAAKRPGTQAAVTHKQSRNQHIDGGVKNEGACTNTRRLAKAGLGSAGRTL